MKFESELKKGNFSVSECTECKKIVWPPSDFCSSCFAKTNWRKASRTGKLLEYSKKQGMEFCVAEFEDVIKIIGTLIVGPNRPQIGQSVQLERCSIQDGNYNFEMSLS